MCLSIFFNKVVVLRHVILLEKRFRHRCFPEIFAKYFGISIFIEDLRWLLLSIASCASKESYITRGTSQSGKLNKNLNPLALTLRLHVLSNTMG